MFYLNQLDYPDMRYDHALDKGGAPEGHNNVASAGCGPCCLSMIVENMTMGHLTLEEALQLSYDHGANRSPGTDLRILGPVVADMYGLIYSETDDIEECIAHLRNGGMAIANSGGDREGYKGVFTKGGHYITVISAEDDGVWILDPTYKTGKFDQEGCASKVDDSRAPLLYCDKKVLAEDCANRSPAYYLFSRKHGKDV